MLLSKALEKAPFGAFFIYMDVMANNCSCVICTSAIPGGRMPRAQGSDNLDDGGDPFYRRMPRGVGTCGSGLASMAGVCIFPH